MKAPIKVVAVRDGIAAVTLIEAGLASMQAMVGGFIECVAVEIPGGEVDMWINEEGLLDNLPSHSIPFYPGQVAGDFFFAGHRDGETISLTDGQCAAILRRLVGHVTVVASGPAIVDVMAALLT